MEYEKEIEEIRLGDGIIRHFPEDLERQYRVGQALIKAGAELLDEVRSKALQFLEDADTNQGLDDVSEYLSPWALGRFQTFFYALDDTIPGRGRVVVYELAPEGLAIRACIAGILSADRQQK
jgi:hypothetical protein